jgi:hypothetical protein
VNFSAPEAVSRLEGDEKVISGYFEKRLRPKALATAMAVLKDVRDVVGGEISMLPLYFTSLIKGNPGISEQAIVAILQLRGLSKQDMADVVESLHEVFSKIEDEPPSADAPPRGVLSNLKL